MHNLFDAYAHRFDLHTPPHHYQHDHQLVLDLARERGFPCRLLDAGCGTGVLVAKALAAGIDAHGIDASQSMIAVARSRAPVTSVRVEKMQDLCTETEYDMIVSMSWSVHYCGGIKILADVLGRLWRALIPGGSLLLQVAHAPHADGNWREDTESGLDGSTDAVSLRYRFRQDATVPSRILADYVYHYPSRDEFISETHVLEVADINVMQRLVSEAGFKDLRMWNSWMRDPFVGASGFIAATRPKEHPEALRCQTFPSLAEHSDGVA